MSRMGGCCEKNALRAITHEGTQITDTMPNDPFKGMVGSKETVFAASALPQFQDVASAQHALDGCFDEVKRLNIFDLKNTQSDGVDRPTKVHLPDGKTIAELDMMIAISTWVGAAWCTSLEHVCVLDHVPGESFTCCIAGDRENIVDGYYRMSGRRDGDVVALNYAKVQSLNGRLLGWVVGKEEYRADCKESANNTIALLEKHARGVGMTRKEVFA